MMFGRQQNIQWLIVCLGNPGRDYEHSRHNIGFMAADALEQRFQTPIRRLKHKSLTATMSFGGTKVLVMKPQTYMNLSGEAVQDAARFYHIPPDRVLVLVDDTALPAGRLRLRLKGSAGGHNGLKNIIAHLGTEEFPRIRIGVGAKPHPDYDMVDWVIAPMKGEDLKAAQQAAARAADAAVCIVEQGFEKAGQEYNK